MPRVTSRRTFLTVGLAGSALLAAGGLAAWIARRDPARDRDDVLGAVVPALLAGALPAQPAQRAQAIERCTRLVSEAIDGLAPSAQDEIAQLFALLAIAPTRLLTTGIASSWAEASPQEVHDFLERWRVHSFALLQSGYQALHDLVIGSWYADESSWPAIGYEGPPKL